MEIFKKINDLAKEAYDKEAAHQKYSQGRFHFQEVEISVDRLLPLNVVDMHKHILVGGVNNNMERFISYLRSINQVLISNGIFYKDVNEHVASVAEMALKSFRKMHENKKGNTNEKDSDDTNG